MKIRKFLFLLSFVLERLYLLNANLVITGAVASVSLVILIMMKVLTMIMKVKVVTKFIFYTGAQSETFQGGESFVKFGYFNKYFFKNSRKKDTAGKISEFFQLDTLKTTF